MMGRARSDRINTEDIMFVYNQQEIHKFCLKDLKAPIFFAVVFSEHTILGNSFNEK